MSTADDEWDSEPTLLELLEGLPDPRLDHNRRHKLVDMLAIAICGALCNVDNYVELERFAQAKKKWLSTFLELPNGIPSHDTFGRLFAALDPVAFEALFSHWLGAWAQALEDVHVAIDGKAIRAALCRAERSSPLLLVSAFAVEAGLVLGQVQTEEGSNEIEAVPRLLEQLKLKGALVTLDAMHCQSETAKALHDKGAQYVLCVKGNQPELRKVIADHFRARPCELVGTKNFLQTVDKGHGRLETRRYVVSDALDHPAFMHLELQSRWPGANLIGCVERTRQILRTGETSVERTHYIAALKEPEVSRFAAAVRGHWAIENQLHWVLDMAFNEDRSTARSKNAARNYARIRKFALDQLRQDKKNKVGLTCKRKMCCWDHDYLLSALKSRPPPPACRPAPQPPSHR